MKKLSIIILLVFASLNTFAQKTWFVGGTTSIAYSHSVFDFGLEPEIGYEFTDWCAVGVGAGFTVSCSEGYGEVLGVTEAFARFTPWHNDIFYIDIKTMGGLGFDEYLELVQVGLRPGVRFRINDHWEVSADLGLFGASCISGYWSPTFGITGSSAGLWCAYRF